MNNTASILLLVFFVITFIQSGYDKLFHWKENLGFLKDHFAQTPLKNLLPLCLFLIMILELTSGILSAVGIVELFVSNGRTFGLYGAISSSVTLLFLLLGQRLAKDYEGAMSIVIYFILAVMAVYWLN